MGSSNPAPVGSLAFKDGKTGIILENSSIFIGIGSLFKDDSVAAQSHPFKGSDDASNRRHILKDKTPSAPSTYVSPQRNDRRTMFLHWLKEEPQKSTAGWLFYVVNNAGVSGIAAHPPKKSIWPVGEDIEAALYRSVVHQQSKPSAKGMVDQIPQSHLSPSVSHGRSCRDNKEIEEDILNVLIQKLYRSLYFKNASWRTCGNASGKAAGSPKTSTTAPQSGQKRANANSNDPTRGDGQDGKSGKGKRAKKGRPNLEEFTTMFACPLCKGDIRFGYERGCRDWKSDSIDTVLRASLTAHGSNRHLATHVEIDHISQAAFDKAQVKELKTDFAFAVNGRAEDLWVAAFMVLFSIPETERHRVPSPYWSMQDDVRDIPMYPTFYANMRQRLPHDRTAAIEVAQYFRENEALAVQRRERREELAREYRETAQRRIEQAQRQTNDELQTALQAMDLDFNRQQAMLDERYIARWGLHNQGSTRMQDILPPGQVSTLPPSPPLPPSAMAMSFPSQSTPDTNVAFDELTQMSTNTTAGDMPRLEGSPPLPPTPPTPVDPALLGTSVEVRPSSMSPFADGLEDPAHDDSGIGMCDNALPCDKDYVCDYHKPFHNSVV